MDYRALAGQMLTAMFTLRGVQPHEDVTEAMRGEMVVLLFIAQHGKPARPSEISSAIKRTTARVAATLNSLERKGLVTREIDTSDRRQILVTLTQAGEAEVTRQREEVLRMVTKTLERLGENDARELVRIILRLAENFRVKSENQKGDGI